MDRAKIADALRAALQSGAVGEHPDTPGVDPKSDLAWVTKATSIGITNPDALKKLIELMEQDFSLC